MIKINSKKIAEILGSSSNVVDVEIENVSSDSRDIRNGDLFIAIRAKSLTDMILWPMSSAKGLHWPWLKS